MRAFGGLLAALTVLAVTPATAGAAIPGPAGSGDASSAQYAPFLGGRGGPLKGPYTPPTLDASSPSGLSGLLLILELAGAALLVAGGALALRGRRGQGEQPRHPSRPTAVRPS
jgi:hypothetical protein